MSTAPGSATDVDAVRAAYGARVAEYIEALGSSGAGDRVVIEAWACTASGPVLDAGCGPGHWAALLHELGLEVEGVDATEEFLAHARAVHPGIPFRARDLRELQPPAGSLGAVLAWFSLIHLHPDDVPDVLRRLSDALRPGGSMLLGFFSGPALGPFDHRVVTAWAWPVAELAAVVERCGMEVVERAERPQPSGRVFAHLVARRLA